MVLSMMIICYNKPLNRYIRILSSVICLCIYDVQVLNYKHYLILFLTYPMSSIHFTIYMYMDIYKDSLYLKKAQRFFDTCHHNLDINVALSCSLLVIAVMGMPYKNTYFCTCVRVYKYREKKS